MVQVLLYYPCRSNYACEAHQPPPAVMTRANNIRLIVFALGCLLVHTATLAHESGSDFLQGLIESDLVFEGSVIGIEYKSALAESGQRRGVPHTFVTFQIDRIFKGSIAGGSTRDGGGTVIPTTLTLRFIGGPAGDDIYFHAIGTPLFDIDDHDVLMVKANGRLICPLVRCEHSRYRIIDRFVYNNHGHEIVSTDQAPVLYGKYHPLPEVLINQIGPVEIGRGGEIEADETGLPRSLPDFGRHYDVESFRVILAETIDTLMSSRLLPATDPVISQDINLDFTGSPPVAVVRLPVVDEEVIPPATGFLIADRLEALFLKFNGGNPVFDRRTAKYLNRFMQKELRRLARMEEKADRPPRHPVRQHHDKEQHTRGDRHDEI